MMKLKSDDLVVIGLSHADLNRLRKNGLAGGFQINGKEMGLAHDLWITAAEDDATMLRAVERRIGESSIVKIDKALRSS